MDCHPGAGGPEPPLAGSEAPPFSLSSRWSPLSRPAPPAFSTSSVFDLPGIALFLPMIGAALSLGIQANMHVMVSVSLVAGLTSSVQGRARP